MPDQFGNFTIADGLNVFQGVQSIQNQQLREQELKHRQGLEDNAEQRAQARFGMQQEEYQRKLAEQEQGRKIQEEAYKVAESIAQQGDVTQFSPEARYKGAQLYYQDKLGQIKTQNQEVLNSKYGMEETMARLSLNLKQAENRLHLYQAARAAGDNEAAKAIALKLNNENMYTGRYVEPTKDGYNVTNQSGQEEKIKDLPIETVDQIIGSYFDRPQEEIMKWQFGAEQYRRQKNEEVLSQAKPYINEKNGQVIYRVPPGTWGKDGKPRPSFFADAQGNEVPEKATSGFTPIKEAGLKADIRRKNAGAASAMANAQAAGARQQASEAAAERYGRPEPINPANVTTSQGGQTGLIMSGKNGVEFQPVDAAPAAGAKTATNPAAAHNLAAKKLETELMPFSGNAGEPTFDPNTGQLTAGGNNALRAALDLVQRSRSGQISPQEQALLPHALKAWQMYEAMNPSQGQTQQTSDPLGIRRQDDLYSAHSGLRP